MAEIIIMPKLGFNMSEGKLIKWYKKEGESVKKGENLFSIETDKTSIDIEATSEGVVKKLLIAEGDVVPVTVPICIVGTVDENIENLMKEGNLESVSEKTTEDVKANHEKEAVFDLPKAAKTNSDIKISPRGRQKAAELGLDSSDFNEIAPTGYGGGISEKDILNYAETSRKSSKMTPLAERIAKEESISLDEVVGSGDRGKIMADDVRAADNKNITIKKVSDNLSRNNKEIVPYTGIRKIIGDRLSMSASSAPHVYFTQSVDLKKLIELRKTVNAAIEEKVSVTDFIVRAAAMALIKYPSVNVSLVEDKIVKYKNVNVGIAVAAPTGLIVPNIKNANDLSPVDIGKASKELIEKARDGKLFPEEYTGGTFTISNLGMFGIDNFTAIINPPESAILAVSATKDKPVVVLDDESGEKTVEIRPVMNIQLSADHRVIDGLLAAQFITEIKALLENPIKLLI